MTPNTSRRQPRTASSLMTGQEALYLRFLSEKQVPVNVKLRDGEVVSGWIEYYDEGMIRLTRESKPNLFIYKQQIRTISELVRKDEGRRRVALRKEAAAEERGIPAIASARSVKDSYGPASVAAESTADESGERPR